MKFEEVERVVEKENSTRFYRGKSVDLSLAIVISSYNRPKMLGQALTSVIGQPIKPEEVFVLDDGSDFDVHEVTGQYTYPVTVIQGPPRSPEERMTYSNYGVLINETMRRMKSRFIQLLCDDDMLAPEWIPTIRHYMQQRPSQQVWVGDLREHHLLPPALPTADNLYPCHCEWWPRSARMTAGNFIYDRAIGVMWPTDNVLSCHDASIVSQIVSYFGGTQAAWYVPEVALWWRYHKHNLSWYTHEDGVHLLPSILDRIKCQRMEEDG